MKQKHPFFSFLGLPALFTLALVSGAAAAAPYYSGTYDSAPQNSGDAAPETPPPTESAPPPVVYRRQPVYRARRYREAPYASDDPAGLAPWPGNFNFGGGPTAVSGSDNPLESGSNFVVGGGYNYSQQGGWILEFADSRLGISDSTLAQNGAIDGRAHVWSVTLNPIWRFRISGPLGGYIIGGGGYYERDEEFTEPVTVFVPTRSGGFFAPGLADVHNNDDAGGLNIGAGLTFNLGWGTKFFMEARYHYLFTSGGGTQIIPVTFGLRW